MKTQSSIPNSMIETMFYKSFTSMDDIQTYRNLVAKGTSQAIASATAFASRKVAERLDHLMTVEHEYRAVIDHQGGSVFLDEPMRNL